MDINISHRELQRMGRTVLSHAKNPPAGWEQDFESLKRDPAYMALHKSVTDELKRQGIRYTTRIAEHA